MKEREIRMPWFEVGLTAIAGVILCAFLKPRGQSRQQILRKPPTPTTGQPDGPMTKHLVVSFDDDTNSWSVVPKLINFVSLGGSRANPFTLKWRIVGSQDWIFEDQSAPGHDAISFEGVTDNQFSDGIIERDKRHYLINNANSVPVNTEYDYTLYITNKHDRSQKKIDPTVKNGPN